jgi:glucokinase
MLGTGIGTAVLIAGRMFEGNSGHGGILGGHLTTTGTATRCNCGNVGCAEATGGGWAVERQLHELMGPQTTDGRLGLKELCSPAMGSDEGDLLLRSAVLDAWCCCALNLVQAYDPQVLLLSGGGSQLPGLERAIRNWLDQHLWGSLPRPEIIVSAHPDMSVLRGLAVWQSSE